MNTEFSLSRVQTDLARLSLSRLTEEAHDNATEHGFTKIYDDLLAAVPEEQRRAMQRTILLAKLALITSEIGEAVSALQHDSEDEFAEEIADIVIRVLDLCGFAHIDLGEEVILKMLHNRHRPYLHGKKC
jgi:NTP pyrophosphatase (non-canonical NTP hydrolase)